MGLCGSSMSTSAKTEMLARTPLFTLPEDELTLLASYFKEVHVPSGERVISEGEHGTTFYVIGEGSVKLTATDVTQNDVHLSTKHTGDFFGHQALFSDDFEWKASVTAASPCLLLSLERAAFAKYLSLLADPSLRARVAEIVGQGMVSNLERVPFLAGLAEWKLQLLASLFKYVTAAQGDVVFAQGSVGHKMFIISRGSMSVRASDGSVEENKDDAGAAMGDKKMPIKKKAREVEVAVLQAGSFFGEIALMANMPRTATLLALEDSLLLSIHKDQFDNFLQVVPELAGRFDSVVKQRTAEQFKKFKVPFFLSLPDDLYPQLAEICEIKEWDAGAAVFKQGDPGETFYIIVYGTVEVFADKKDGNGPVKIVTMRPGSYFGEVALVQDVLRTASVIAETRCVFLTITRDRFQGFFRKYPEAFSDFEIKLRRHDVSLLPVLHHKVGLRYFTQHCQSEYSTENINFWLACRDFLLLYDVERAALARAVGIIGASSSSGSMSSMSEGGDGDGDADGDDAKELTEAERRLREAAQQKRSAALEEKRVKLARSVSQRFIGSNAEQQVNISAKMAKAIHEALEKGEVARDMFNDAIREVEDMLTKDSFSRFKQSAKFEDFLRECGAYAHADIRAGAPSESSVIGSTTSLADRPAE